MAWESIVRMYIIHWGPPESIEAYIQESGRAGRDGKHACALLLVNDKDISKKFLQPNIVTHCKNSSLPKIYSSYEF